MKLIQCMGGLWRLSDANYFKMLWAKAREQDFDLDDHGRYIGSVDTDVTDMDQEEAKDTLRGFGVKFDETDLPNT